MNNVVLVGRLTKDCELKGDSGKEYLKNSIAIKDRFNKEKTDFINVIAFSGTAKFINSFFNKGDMIGIIGRITTGNYKNKDGVTVYTTDVIIEQAYFVGSKSKQDNNQSNFQSEELPFDLF